MAFEMLSKLDILGRDAVLPDVGQEEKRQHRAEQTQTGTNEERILAPSSAVRPARSLALNNREDVCPDKSPNLAPGRCDRVVLAADGGGASLGSHEADVIAWPDLAQREENTERR